MANIGDVLRHLVTFADNLAEDHRAEFISAIDEVFPRPEPPAPAPAPAAEADPRDAELAQLRAENAELRAEAGHGG